MFILQSEALRSKGLKSLKMKKDDVQSGSASLSDAESKTGKAAAGAVSAAQSESTTVNVSGDPLAPDANQNNVEAASLAGAKAKSITNDATSSASSAAGASDNLLNASAVNSGIGANTGDQVMSVQPLNSQNTTVDNQQNSGDLNIADKGTDNANNTLSGNYNPDLYQTGNNDQYQQSGNYTVSSNDGMITTQNGKLLADGNTSPNMEQEQLVNQFLINSQYPLQQQIQAGGVCETAEWTPTNLKARDVGVNFQGELYAAGLDGFLYFYEFLANRWKKVVGDYELTSIKRVDVSYDGVPYVVTSCGDTFYLSCDNKWIRLPGCAKDIGAGRGGEIFKTGCDEREGGFGIYRLFCKCECKNCYQGCQRWKKSKTCTGNCDAKKNVIGSVSMVQELELMCLRTDGLT